MSRIVAGVFDDNAAADGAIAELQRAGYVRTDIDRFVVNPPGRHDRLPFGGDQDADPGSVGGETGALSGAAVGGALGAAAGLAVMSLLGPIGLIGGIAAGAYAGSLAGAMRSLGEPVERGLTSNTVRQAGVMVAVNARTPADEQTTARALRDAGARTIEWDEGTWRNGHWADFDPVAQPRRIESLIDNIGRLGARHRHAH